MKRSLSSEKESSSFEQEGAFGGIYKLDWAADTLDRVGIIYIWKTFITISPMSQEMLGTQYFGTLHFEQMWIERWPVKPPFQIALFPWATNENMYVLGAAGQPEGPEDLKWEQHVVPWVNVVPGPFKISGQAFAGIMPPLRRKWWREAVAEGEPRQTRDMIKILKMAEWKGSK